MLRDYQQHAVKAVVETLEVKQSTLLIAPTGSGKSIIIAALCKHYAEQRKKVLVVSHVKEIIEQNAEKVIKILPGAPIAFYSASFGQKRFAQITFATIQSIAKLEEFPVIDVLIIDEAHLVPREGMGNYQKLIKKLGNVKTLGLTATPFRLDSGVLFGEGEIFSSVCYEISILKLIYDGYLSPLISKKGVAEVDKSKITSSGKDYNLDSINANFDDILIDRATNEIVSYGKQRKSWLLFGASIKHAERLNAALRRKGVKSEVVSSQTIPMLRQKIFTDFKAGTIKCLVGCEIFTTGFDAPNVDLVALLRPTKSAGLFVQMVGRGMRIAPGKKNCLILDYAGNVELHGAIDKIRVGRRKRKNGKDFENFLESAPVKFCPECKTAISIRLKECGECGYVFENEDILNHSTTSSENSPLSIEPEVANVREMVLRSYVSRGGVKMLRVDYLITQFFYISTYFSFELPGKPRKKAQLWWRGLEGPEPLPKTDDEAVERALELRQPAKVHYLKDDNFFNVVGIEFADEASPLEEYGINI